MNALFVYLSCIRNIRLCPDKPSDRPDSPRRADCQSARRGLGVRTARTLSPQGSKICGLPCLYWEGREGSLRRHRRRDLAENGETKKEASNRQIVSFLFLVGATGLEPATSRPPDVCATNCAKPRAYLQRGILCFLRVQRYCVFLKPPNFSALFCSLVLFFLAEWWKMCIFAARKHYCFSPQRVIERIYEADYA